MTVAVLLLSGGRGSRVGGDIPKQYREIAGVSVLRRAIDCFADHPLVDLIRVVIHPDDRAMYEQTVAGLDILAPVLGGAERHLSALNGLKSLAPHAPDIVLIHDAARPFVSAPLINRVIKNVEGSTGVIPALPVSDTLKRVAPNSSRILETVDRASLWRAQTPQGFPYFTIMEAHTRREGELPTDDASVLEAAGGTVVVVEGDERNIKVTTEQDFERVERLPREKNMQVRVGSGFDVHQFGPGNSVTLCGVEIPFEHGLAGHSDADVALHALTDALLGAVGAGDIGQHFPPTDDKWKGAASHIFVEEATRHIRDAGGTINNVDITIIGERPKIGPFRSQMRAEVAKFLSIPETCVNIKATTTEKLGFTGRAEGLAAQAVTSVEVPSE